MNRTGTTKIFFLGFTAGTALVLLGAILWIKLHPSTLRALPPPTSTASSPIPVSCKAFEQQFPSWLPLPQDAARAHPVAVDQPKSLLRRILLWKSIWGERALHEHLLVDQRWPWIIHATVDCRDLFSPVTDRSEGACHTRLEAKRKEVQKQLFRRRLRPDRNLLLRYERNRRFIRDAHRKVISVEGRRENLAAAWKRSEGFLWEVEEVFRKADVPPALARMMIVESLANPNAISAVGAVGVFQFMVNTGQQFLKIGQGVDERLDPLRAGWAAARYLRSQNARFKSWPLTLTAYVAGPTRLARMLSLRRSRDLGEVVNRGDVAGFSFDSQNYYAQIAAVVDLTASWKTPQPAQRRLVVNVPEPMPLSKIAICLQASHQMLVEANPSLTEPIRLNSGQVPAGYQLTLWLPEQPSGQPIPVGLVSR